MPRLFFRRASYDGRAFLGNDPQGGAKRSAVTLGLNENGRDLPHRVYPGPEAEVFIGRASVWKKGQFCRRQRQFLGKRYIDWTPISCAALRKACSIDMPDSTQMSNRSMASGKARPIECWRLPIVFLR